MKYSTKMTPLELTTQFQKKKNDDGNDDGLTKTIAEFTTELDKLLNNSRAMTPEQQYQIYMQLFRRYQMLAEEKRQPTTFILKQPIDPPFSMPSPPPLASTLRETSNEQRTTPSSTAIHQEYWPDEYVLKGIPRNKQSQASSLLQFIKQNPRVHLNNRGEIIVDDRTILGSHIVDLVHDFTCERKFAASPLGHKALASVLKTSNVPKRYIGNPNRWSLIQDINENFVEPVSLPVFKRNSRRAVASSSSSSSGNEFITTDDDGDDKPITSAAAAFLGVKRKSSRSKKGIPPTRYSPFFM